MPVDASVTITVLSTSVVVSISSSTSYTSVGVTTTVTDVAATPTILQACHPDNIITTYLGQTISAINYNYDIIGGDMNVDNAIDCCTMCQNTAGCGESVWHGGNCYLAKNAGTCNGAVVDAYFYAGPNEGDGGELGIAVSNGPCGQIIYDPTEPPITIIVPPGR
jgi:hypothetical protein